jgi:hypothetical protein
MSRVMLETYKRILINVLAKILVGESRDRSPVTGDFFRGIRQFYVP